ncbi:hypothetical protein [Mycolicibacterium hippocampi]|uniref:hypothetical protein n=1 Tax=Mycolicibacterium hippocampi TaxID=659824 RepID=UPI0035191471
MNTVLYLSAHGAVYEARAYTAADISELIQSPGLHCLTSSDRQFDFWVGTSTQDHQRRPNRRATELLLATTDLNAKTVPLLRGCVVVATHDADGDLDGLSWQQLDALGAESRRLTPHEDRVLSRRIRRDARGRHPKTHEVQPAAVSCARPRTLVHI